MGGQAGRGDVTILHTNNDNIIIITYSEALCARLCDQHQQAFIVTHFIFTATL